MSHRKRLGLIVNPIAGMGGGVGLKGTDNPDTLQRARELGAIPRSRARARVALEVIADRLGESLEILTAPGTMGEEIAVFAGLTPIVIDHQTGDDTTPGDTQRSARRMVRERVDLLLFAGGDGTARDIYEAVGVNSVTLGIPTGVKMHSAVYAINPRAAGEAAARFLQYPSPKSRMAEVMDIDEEQFRIGRVSARLFGALLIPDLPGLVQNLKSGSGGSDAAALAGIAGDVIERMQDGALYIVGPGTTTKAVADRLGVPKTLLGVDLYCRSEVIATDVTESQLLGHLDGTPARIVVTPIGGQGFLFGRGNQQLSAEVIRQVGRSNIIVVATPAKIAGLRGDSFLIDTGNIEIDELLTGYVRVITGYHMESVYRVA